MNSHEKTRGRASAQEQREAAIEEVMRALGAAWKALPVEAAIGYISEYEIISSRTVGEEKILRLRKSAHATHNSRP